MTINERAAYIKGLFDASDFNPEDKMTKVVSEVLTLLSDVADKLTALDAENAEVRDYLDELDADLGQVEEDLYLVDGDEDEEYEGEDGEYYELECPHCGEMICFDDSLDPEELECPSCGEKIGDVDFCDGNCEGCAEDCRSAEDDEE